MEQTIMDVLYEQQMESVKSIINYDLIMNEELQSKHILCELSKFQINFQDSLMSNLKIINNKTNILIEKTDTLKCKKINLLQKELYDLQKELSDLQSENILLKHNIIDLEDDLVTQHIKYKTDNPKLYFSRRNLKRTIPIIDNIRASEIINNKRLKTSNINLDDYIN